MNRSRSLALVFVLTSWSFAEACGGDDANQADASPDATTNDGAGNDTGTNDAAKDTGSNDAANDSGGNDAANDSGGNDSGGGLVYTCPADGGIVTSCAQCAGSTEPCVFCGVTDASVLVGTCVQLGHNCGPSPTTGYAVCTCVAGDAAACPEAYQVCHGAQCVTCGENNFTNNLTCENGGKCDNADGGCI